MKKLFLLLVGVCALPLTQSLAQAGSDVRLSFKTIGMGVSSTEICIKQSKGYVPLTIETDSISLAASHYTGPAVMPLYRKTKAAEGFNYSQIGAVTFPPIPEGTTGNFLLLIGAGPGGGLMATPVPNDTTSFPAQTLRVISVLPAPAGVMVNKKPEMMNPGDVKLFDMSSAPNDRAEIHIAVQHKGKWVEANNNVYACEKDARRTVFVINQTPANAPAGRVPVIGFYSLVDRPKDMEMQVAASDIAP